QVLNDFRKVGESELWLGLNDQQSQCESKYRVAKPLHARNIHPPIAKRFAGAGSASHHKSANHLPYLSCARHAARRYDSHSAMVESEPKGIAGTLNLSRQPEHCCWS